MGLDRENYTTPYFGLSQEDVTGSHADVITASCDPNVTSCDVNVTASPLELQRDELLAKFEIGILATIFILAVVGNGVVLIAVWISSRTKKLSRMNLLIMHLSIADLSVAFFNVLPQLFWDVTFVFKGGDFLCRSVTYLQVVVMYASSYVLIATALDRYIALCHPIASHTWSNRRTHGMVAVAWVISFLLSTPQLFIFGFRDIGLGLQNCVAIFNPTWTMLAYVTGFTVAIYIIPTLILVFTYGRICFVVWHASSIQELSIRSASNANNHNQSTSVPESRGLMTSRYQPRVHVRSLTSSKVKTVKLTLTVIVCYFLCWSPFFIGQMWSAWDVKAPFQGKVMVIIMLLASLNSCTNPWIYLAFTSSLQATLCCRKSHHPPTMRRGSRPSISFSFGRTELSRFDGSVIERENGFGRERENGVYSSKM